MDTNIWRCKLNETQLAAQSKLCSEWWHSTILCFLLLETLFDLGTRSGAWSDSKQVGKSCTVKKYNAACHQEIQPLHTIHYCLHFNIPSNQASSKIANEFSRLLRTRCYRYASGPTSAAGGEEGCEAFELFIAEVLARETSSSPSPCNHQSPGCATLFYPFFCIFFTRAEIVQNTQEKETAQNLQDAFRSSCRRLRASHPRRWPAHPCGCRPVRCCMCACYACAFHVLIPSSSASPWLLLTPAPSPRSTSTTRFLARL